MAAAVRYEVHLDQPVLAWQAAVLLKSAVVEPKALLLTVHCFDTEGRLTRHEEKTWLHSTQFDADFCYLPAAGPGAIVSMPKVRHAKEVASLAFAVRPFAAQPQPVPSTVSTLFLLSLGSGSDLGPAVVTTHSPKETDV